MTLIFYLLIVWLTPANFSWLWLLIALLMQFFTWVSFSMKEFESYVHKAQDDDNDTNYWRGGPLA